MAEPGAGRLSPNVVAAAVLAIVAASLVLWQQPWQGDDAGASVPAPPADAAAVLREQTKALSEAGSREELRAAAGPGRAARAWADDAWAAQRTLGVRGATWTYLRGGDVADRADGSAAVVVEVRWRTEPGSVLAGARTAGADVTLRVRPTEDGTFSVVDAAGTDRYRLPLWLAGRVEVSDAGSARVVTVDGGLPDVDTRAQTAAAQRQVDRVVPQDDRADRTSRLLVVAPRTMEQAAQLLGRRPADVKQIAAVTTTVDGESGTPAQIVLNPALFETMDQRAQQVVMSHEATHLLVGTSKDLPAWVAEGFADFVALRDDTAPLSLSAGQVLRQVKADGAPRALPEQSDFDGSTHGLGAVYESSWMAFRMLTGSRSDDSIVAFYAAVRDGTPVEVAAERDLDLTLAQITRQWRTYLTKSASTVS
ncbi:hypothetical protein ASD11_05180 [Aeromicrobium sp. Root495]|uniref:hypothetical protein n=1 Tax=Aeromicrobium sp. Root495 TaxID=1736550 RepID=UPI0006FC58A7|nr:hypothetical protein [Aeromicrobium sp. Root495]KQY59002.1 hypothetical protein ASD11_05180 [Aeromicrobium sp. Root495]